MALQWTTQLARHVSEKQLLGLAAASRVWPQWMSPQPFSSGAPLAQALLLRQDAFFPSPLRTVYHHNRSVS